MKTWLIKHRRAIIGGLLGAVGGYLYWQFVGCSSGNCPITSSPLNSTLYGVLLGALFGSSIDDKKNKDK